MDVNVNPSVDASDWTLRFSSQSPKRRRIALTHAVGKVVSAETLPSEKEISRRLILAALEIDPNLVLDVIASMRGDSASSADIEKLKQEAKVAQANFEGLVNATQTLRTSLTNMGAIKKDDRLPEVEAEWGVAIGNLVAKRTRQLDAQAAYLVEQKAALEKRRTEILAEINMARKLVKENTPLLSKLSVGMFKGLTEKSNKGISSLSFDYKEIKAPEIGELVQGEGIFTKLWTPKYSNGQPLGIECELYTAPKDLKHAPNVDGLQTYLNSVRAVAGLKGWEGHDGGDFANEVAYLAFLDKMVKDFTRKNSIAPNTWFRPDGIGVWALPPAEIVDGKVENENGRRIKAYDENHYDLRDVGAFARTFTTASGSAGARWYWSCTEHREYSDNVWGVGFTDGDGGWDRKDNHRLSTRPVRVGRVRHLTI